MDDIFYGYEIVFLYEIWWNVLPQKEKDILSDYTKEALHNKYVRLVNRPSLN